LSRIHLENGLGRAHKYEFCRATLYLDSHPRIGRAFQKAEFSLLTFEKRYSQLLGS
jgi:hypothetical protein